MFAWVGVVGGEESPEAVWGGERNRRHQNTFSSFKLKQHSVLSQIVGGGGETDIYPIAFNCPPSQ